nr:MAG TPA: hypothetical protein [Caudoviricetes sp.]
MWFVFFRHKNPLCLNCYFWRFNDIKHEYIPPEA